MRPGVAMLDEPRILGVVDDALRTLESVGVMVENEAALALLRDAGQQERAGRVLLSQALVSRSLERAPSTVKLYDRAGALALELGERRVHFDPGSAALYILDAERGERRLALAADARHLAWVTQACSHIQAQSTGLVPSDIPGGVADRYRLFVALRHCHRPVVTGTFVKEGFAVMRALLSAVRGGDQALRDRPLAIFDCCPSPPLRWSDLTCQALMDAARAGIPAELVSMPMAGATAPVTLREVVVQHCAESLSGLVIHQLACPGAPIIWGGAPAALDMRHGTTPMGAMETMMVDMANAQVGRHLDLPTHAYMGGSEAKTNDWQAGMEAGMGLALGALAGVNLIAGPGMLDYLLCQSLEKLLLDDQACGMALRLVRGIEQRSSVPTPELLAQVVGRDHFLSHPHTRQHFRQELFFPSPLIDRGSHGEWETRGRPTAADMAHEQVKEILAAGNPAPLDPALDREMVDIIQKDADALGLGELLIV